MIARSPVPRLLAALVVTPALLGACRSGGSDRDQATVAQTTVTADRSRAEIGADEGVFGRIPEVVREVEPSVVAVLTDRGEGSGVVWDAEGTIVTNHHVAAGASRIRVSFADGTQSPARLLASDQVTDLAVLRAERNGLPPARFADQLPEIGELAIAIGNPLGFENTVTAGIVSGLNRSIPGSAPESQALVDLIQTDAPISPGNSGGALVNAAGRVIGVNVAYIPPEARAVSIGFAIPAPTVVDVVRQLLDDGSVSHAFFGIRPAQLTPQIGRRLGVEAEAGVVVLSVVPEGPADEAGIRAGDVITAIDDRSVETIEEFLAVLRARDPGQRITVGLTRGDEERGVTLRLADRPPAAPG